MAKQNGEHQAADPVSQFWGDMMSRLGGFNPTQPPTPETAKHMQQAFFESMAKYCDEYMRSEQFLTMIRDSMERSLAFKQYMDQFLTELHHGTQSPAKADMEDLTTVLRGIEQRIVQRLDTMEDRLAAVEDGNAPKRAGKHSAGDRSGARSGHGASKKKSHRGK